MPNDGGVGWADPSAIPPNSAFSRQLAGVVVNEHTALSVITVLSCVRLISGAGSRLPLDALRKVGKTRRLVTPEPQIVADPFGHTAGGISRREGIRMGYISLMLRGNAYYYVLLRDGLGFPILLEPLPPQVVVCKKEKGVITYKVNNKPVNANDVLHLRWITLPGGVVGLDPISYAAAGIGLSLATEEYGGRFFEQGATLAGILESDQTITKQTARRIAQDFARHHGGLAQAHLPLIVDGGLKWKQLSVSPEQAQFLATRQYQKSEIGMLYGVPPYLLGDMEKQTSFGQGIQDAKLDFLTFTLEDYTAIFEDAWNSMTPDGVYTRFNYDAFLRTNTVDRYNAYLVARTGGWLNNEEIRAREDEEPSGDEAMSDYQQPLNSSPKPAPSGSPGTSGDEKPI